MPNLPAFLRSHAREGAGTSKRRDTKKLSSKFRSFSDMEASVSSDSVARRVDSVESRTLLTDLDMTAEMHVR
ncbi:hypothetical protein CDL15_Pgr009783 [Punica granatum]|uniref:Uncharacterized protein n=1 Tax=Punica granatum TaxID=22663 RepID=A0A218W3G0_PUNGR|nr:hypothetical protein CDL15_Pgr000535 [Punica granatum]OWM76137.1 hypothetical protein CDL15_Pgr009783 [Punica granatum]